MARIGARKEAKRPLGRRISKIRPAGRIVVLSQDRHMFIECRFIAP
jgi:hypothetical protein